MSLELSTLLLKPYLRRASLCQCIATLQNVAMRWRKSHITTASAVQEEDLSRAPCGAVVMMVHNQ